MTGKTPKIRRPRGALGEIILSERRRRGWSGTDLARRSKMLPARLFAYETSQLAPGPRTLPRILQSLQLPDEFAPFLTALAKIDIRLMRQAHAVDALRSELGQAARVLVRQGVALAKKADELRRQESAA